MLTKDADKKREQIQLFCMDPVTLIKIPFIQYLYRIKSMRQTIKEIDKDRDAHGKKPILIFLDTQK